MSERTRYYEQIEKLPSGLVRDALETLIANTSEEKLQAALLYQKIRPFLAGDAVTPFGKKYKSRLEGYSNSLPAHKINWMARAADILALGIEATEQKQIKHEVYYHLVNFSGLLKERYVPPEALEVYNNPENWVEQRTYDDDTILIFKGSYETKKLIYGHSQLSKEELVTMILEMNQDGYITYTQDVQIKLQY